VFCFVLFCFFIVFIVHITARGSGPSSRPQAWAVQDKRAEASVQHRRVKACLPHRPAEGAGSPRRGLGACACEVSPCRPSVALSCIVSNRPCATCIRPTAVPAGPPEGRSRALRDSYPNRERHTPM
jgi:hypothetical protein